MSKTCAYEKFTYIPAKKESDGIPLWLCFPSTYMIGMSSLGYLTLFRILDQNPGVHPERIFVDTEKTYYNPKSVELIGFSFSFELDFISIFKILEKYGIPLKSSERTDEHPLIFGGGPVLTSNPEPYAEFFDVINIGEGEDALTEMINVYKEVRYLKRKDKLNALSQVDGTYVPSLYDVEYNSDNSIKAFNKNSPNAPDIIHRRCTQLSECIYSPIITNKSMFSEMFLIETARGCPKRCRFCIASYLTLPARYPDCASIEKAIDTALEYTHKIGLLGALITEHPDFDKICEYILAKRENNQFEISVSSLRADGITPLIAKTLAKCGQKQTTIAVEAGSQRLRNVINKKLSEFAILNSVKTARENGLAGLKIYGIIGLPTETQQDIDELVSLINKLKKDNKAFKLTLSISSFVPKAQTPFQWDKREGNKLLQEKNEYLRKELNNIKVPFKPASIKWDYIQSVLSRGDRRLAPLIELVYKYKGSLGSWGRSLKELTEENKIFIPDLDWYGLRERNYNEIFPWELINSGVDKNILMKERDNSISKEMADSL